MASPLNLALGAVGQPRPDILYGTVSTSQPAPASFTSTLFVVFPQWDASYNWQFSDWPACHGSTLPAQGATVIVVRDDQQNLRVVWWDSATTAFVPTGPTALLPGDLITSAAATRAGCLLCDGTSYLTATYPALQNAIGYAYGGSGANFNVPDLRGRAPIGAGTGTAAGATAWSLGSQPTNGAGGEEKHTLVTAEMPAHAHTMGGGQSVNWPTNGSGGVAYSVAGGATFGFSGLTMDNAGSGTAHNNMQPVSVVNWFIKT